VELLVVIVVLGLLLTLTVPSLRMAMAHAQQYKCTSNLRLQAQAHSGYSGEFDFNKVPLIWNMGSSYGYYMVSPNVKMYRQPVGQGILVEENYLALATLLCPSSSMLDDSLNDQEAWVKSTISGSSYSYFWRHSSTIKTRSDAKKAYKYTDAQNEGRYGLSMDFNAMSGHSYTGSFGSDDWPSHPVLGQVNISYSDGSVVTENNTSVILKPPFTTKAKMEWWERAHKARKIRD
jgi:type II secretory pathway pseudopilin PulG